LEPDNKPVELGTCSKLCSNLFIEEKDPE